MRSAVWASWYRLPNLELDAVKAHVRQWQVVVRAGFDRFFVGPGTGSFGRELC